MLLCLKNSRLLVRIIRTGNDYDISLFKQNVLHPELPFKTVVCKGGGLIFMISTGTFLHCWLLTSRSKSEIIE